eukprot:14162713-Alexandrium_andersonii.AAC.1
MATRWTVRSLGCRAAALQRTVRVPPAKFWPEPTGPHPGGPAVCVLSVLHPSSSSACQASAPGAARPGARGSAR